MDNFVPCNFVLLSKVITFVYMKISQNKQILTHLKEVGDLTSLDALTLFGCLRLASRINDLRNDGHVISTTPAYTRKGKRIARYFYQGEEKEQA